MEPNWLVEKAEVTAILTEPLGNFGPPTLVPESNVFEAYRMLFESVEAGKIEDVELALKQGADPNRRNWSGQSLLHEAANHGHTMIVDLLLKYGASPNSRGVENSTPLHIACFKGHFMIASALSNSGADLNAQDKLGNTPLHEAASKGRAGLVALLLSQGNRIDAHRKNARKQEPKDICPSGDCLKLLTGEISDPILYSGQIFASLDTWDGDCSSCSEDSNSSGEELSEDESSSDAMDIQ